MNVLYYLPIKLKLCQNLTESKARKPGQGSFLVHPGEPVVDGKDGGLGGGWHVLRGTDLGLSSKKCCLILL